MFLHAADEMEEGFGFRAVSAEKTFLPVLSMID
jgi:hypothetical protein